MLTKDLTGPDLCYWVARANAHGSRHESNVLRRHYGEGPNSDPVDEPAKRAFIQSKLGQVLPERSLWQ